MANLGGLLFEVSFSIKFRDLLNLFNTHNAKTSDCYLSGHLNFASIFCILVSKFSSRSTRKFCSSNLSSTILIISTETFPPLPTNSTTSSTTHGRRRTISSFFPWHPAKSRPIRPAPQRFAFLAAFVFVLPPKQPSSSAELDWSNVKHGVNLLKIPQVPWTFPEESPAGTSEILSISSASISMSSLGWESSS